MTIQRDAQLYLLNLALLATHEIDSAYWHEWEMFLLPGGIQFFLLVNLLLLLILLYGFAQVVRRAPGAGAFVCILAAAGLIAFVLHSGFLVFDYPQFRLPVSIGLLLAILATSIAQLIELQRKTD